MNKSNLHLTLVHHQAILHFDTLPNSAQVRLPVVKQILGISAATVWRLVKNKKLKTYKLTVRTTTFNVGELKEFLSERTGA